MFAASLSRGDPRHLRRCYYRQRQSAPSVVFRYADPTTEFPVFRLTDPEHTQRSAAALRARRIAQGQLSCIYASDASGSMQAYRLDLKSGQARLLTEAENLDPACFTLVGR